MKLQIVDERLFFCEACQGYALIQKDNFGKITVEPCGCKEAN